MALVLNTIPQIQKAIQDLYEEVQKLKVEKEVTKPAEPVVARRGRPRVEAPVEAPAEEV